MGFGGSLATLVDRHPERSRYLNQRAEPGGLGLLLLLMYVYACFRQSGPSGVVLSCAFLVTALWLARPPRWLLYLALVLTLLGLVYWHVQGVATGPHDITADRDDAVEIGARALLQGRNPWSELSPLHEPITTGPTSMFLALPFVALTGHVNLLTVMFWTLFVALLLIGDVRSQNRTFPALAAVLFLPMAGFFHTLTWALDELYYGAIITPLIWFALARQRLFLAGALCSALLLSRLSYAFALLGIALWWLLAERRSLQAVLKIVAGALSSGGLTLVVLRLVGGPDVWHRNFLHALLEEPLDSRANKVTAILSKLIKLSDYGAWGAALLVVALTVAAGVGLRQQKHPFWHMAVGLMLAHLLPFAPPTSTDYILLVMIPAMYGVAFETPDQTGAGGALDSRPFATS